jgi:hypothetical protein
MTDRRGAAAPDRTRCPSPYTDAYIARHVARDPDVWVLEIEDRKGTYQLDGKVV